LATKSEEIQGELLANESVWAIETKPLPATLLRIATLLEPEALPTTRWVWIVAVVIILFGLVIEGNYWLSQRRPALVTAGRAPPPNALVKPIPTAAEPPPLSITQASIGKTHL
jgi:hypothetical protein